jgi:ABC-type sugar transport system permease subunit
VGYYNWEVIFKTKTDNELLSIYAGNSHLDFEGRIYAALELKKRDFNFEKIQAIHKKNIANLRNEIESYKTLKFTKTKHFRGLLFTSAFLVSILIAAISNAKAFLFQNIFEQFRFWLIIISSILYVVTARWIYKYQKRKFSEAILHKIELLKLLDLPAFDN